MWHLRLGPCSCVDVGAVSRVISSLAHKAPLRPGTYMQRQWRDARHFCLGFFFLSFFFNSTMKKKRICHILHESLIELHYVGHFIRTFEQQIVWFASVARWRASAAHFCQFTFCFRSTFSPCFSFRSSVNYRSFAGLAMKHLQDAVFLARCLQLVCAFRISTAWSLHFCLRKMIHINCYL